MASLQAGRSPRRGNLELKKSLVQSIKLILGEFYIFSRKRIYGADSGLGNHEFAAYLKRNHERERIYKFF